MKKLLLPLSAALAVATMSPPTNVVADGGQRDEGDEDVDRTYDFGRQVTIATYDARVWKERRPGEFCVEGITVSRFRQPEERRATIAVHSQDGTLCIGDIADAGDGVCAAATATVSLSYGRPWSRRIIELPECEILPTNEATRPSDRQFRDALLSCTSSDRPALVGFGTFSTRTGPRACDGCDPVECDPCCATCPD
jgi:hypothetical protein